MKNEHETWGFDRNIGEYEGLSVHGHDIRPRNAALDGNYREQWLHCGRHM
jgi:hypothetical protein